MKICVLVEQNRKKEIENLLGPSGWDMLFLPCDKCNFYDRRIATRLFISR